LLITAGDSAGLILLNATCLKLFKSPGVTTALGFRSKLQFFGCQI
jgi:hypothetical protein